MDNPDTHGRMRARQAGILLGNMTPGPTNSIADVAGVCVGHATLLRGSGTLVRGVGPVRTGVTAILPHHGDVFASKVPAAAEVFNGFGKTIGLVQIAELGQLETPILLTNTLNVGRVADAPIQEGNLGAGTGMIAYGFAGGIGTASRQLAAAHGGYTLGALVLANFGRRGDLVIAGVPIGRKLEARRQRLAKEYAARAEQREQGSVIVLLATDAPLDARQLGRLTRRVPLGLARTGTHGGHGSGDLALAFSTATRITHDSTPLVQKVEVFNEQHPAMDDLFVAVVESTEEAVINALCAARPMDGRDHHLGEALPLAEVVRCRVAERTNAGSLPPCNAPQGDGIVFTYRDTNRNGCPEALQQEEEHTHLAGRQPRI